MVLLPLAFAGEIAVGSGSAPVTAPPAPVVATTPLDAGLSALKAKKPDDAIAALATCAAELPACRWQLGWAYWLKRDWVHVVTTWESLPPDYEQVSSQLPIARGQVKAVELAAELRRAAPATFVSAAPTNATIRLRAVGDMMIGTAFPEGNLPPDAGAAAFINVSGLTRDADVTFGNLEGPLCDDPTPSTKCRPDAAEGSCYAFRSPTAYAHWYKDAGFDVVSTANNHASDFGEICRDQTDAALDGQGILHSGRPGSVARWTTADGMKIALIGFHTSPSAHDLNDLPTAVALVSGLAADSDIVIVSFHGGAEGSKAIHVPVGHETFYGEDRGDLRTFTHAMIDAGADLVLGHGPHVLRAMEGYNGRLIAYSLGNFSTYGRFNLTGNQGLGAVVEVSLDREGKFLSGKILGTTQEGEGIPTPDASNAAADLVRMLTTADFPATGAQIAQDGSIALTATPPDLATPR